MRPNVNLLDRHRSEKPQQQQAQPEKIAAARSSTEPTTRSTVNDGFGNRAEFYAMTHFRPFWDGIQRFRPTQRGMNRLLINLAILKMPTRPEPLSTMAGYTSWDSLTDRTFDGRHLPAKPAAQAPEIDAVVNMFRRDGETRLCPKSTLLFATFAQWFTDGFLRSDRSEPRNPRKNTSNHDIDLCQVYGLNRTTTRLLRAYKGGKLKSQTLHGEEFPPYLCKNGVIKDEFDGLRVLKFELCEKPDTLFAMGGDRANSQLGYLAMNVLFFREHNRIAEELAGEHSDWDDERLFQTARNILIALLIKIVVCEYINHIAPYHFKFSMTSGGFPRAKWFRQNWMAVEFNLLYRWHSLIPSTIRVADEEMPVEDTIFNTERLVDRGLGPLFEDFSHQRVGRIGLFNTAPALLEIEERSILQSRQVELDSYNAYRANSGFPRVTDFDQISSDPAIQRALRETYRTVDDIEFYVGLFAEDRKANSALPPLIGRMVAIDALSQAFTNPLLAPRVFNDKTFSELGMKIIEETNSLSDIVQRNAKPRDRAYFVSMTREGWQRNE